MHRQTEIEPRQNENCGLLRQIEETDLNDLGRLQFFIQQTTGNKPEVPDSYYNTLVEEKRKLDFLVEEYIKMYYNGRLTER